MDYIAGPLDMAKNAAPLLGFATVRLHLLRLFIRFLLEFIRLRISICHSRPLTTHPFRNKFIAECLCRDEDLFDPMFSSYHGR